MLRLHAKGQACLLEALLPAGAVLLPASLAAIDELLEDPDVYAPIRDLWVACDKKDGTAKLTDGRPTIAMVTFVRLMVLKARLGWGYEALVREVADSLHLRRFCLIGIGDAIPDESTVRKLCRRLGPDTVNRVVHAVIARSAAQTGFRPRAARTQQS